MNQYSKLSEEKLKDHLEMFLVDHWSHSSVMNFVSNEKTFEQRYIYKDRDTQRSLASIIGSVYDRAISQFFTRYRDTGELISLDELLIIGHDHLDNVGANQYRPQLKKSITDLQLDALKAVNFLLQSFVSEFDAYEQEIQEILWIQRPFMEFVQINGVDVPLPLKAVPDVVFVHKDGSLAVWDDKAKRSYTTQNDVKMKYANQSIVYTLVLAEAIKKEEALIKKYPKLKEGVKQFFFFENKYTKNRDGSRQIKQIPFNMNEEGPLFEQMLFEGLMKMIEAVQDPDHVYTMNPRDFMQDGARTIDFWIKTHLTGLEGFPNIAPHVKKKLKNRRSQIRRDALTSVPKSVIKAYTTPKEFISFNPKDMENLSIPERIEHRLRSFSYPVKVEHVIDGYSCDTYLVQVGAGLQTSKIYGYRMDIANALGVNDVRIAPDLVEYEGGAFVAIEVNRRERTMLKLTDSDIPDGLKLPLGKDNFGKVISWDIENPSTPHMMISGSTGSGKSVAIKSILYAAEKKGMDIKIIDPKNIDFASYKDKYQVMTDLEVIEDFIEKKVEEMDKIFQSGKSPSKQQLIIFDEAADCLMRQTSVRRILVDEDGYEVEMPVKKVKEATSEDEARELRDQWAEVHRAKKKDDPQFKTLEENLLILAQKARSAGIHLLLAAQRFSVKILTGDVKANFPARLCLTAAKAVDSKVMLDTDGAEKLNGKGDALFLSPEHPDPVRLQCFYS